MNTDEVRAKFEELNPHSSYIEYSEMYLCYVIAKDCPNPMVHSAAGEAIGWSNKLAGYQQATKESNAELKVATDLLDEFVRLSEDYVTIGSYKYFKPIIKASKALKEADR